MEKLLAFLFAFLAMLAISIFFGGWVVMITAGMLHHEAIPQLPAYGFRPSVFISIGLGVLGSYFRSYSKS